MKKLTAFTPLVLLIFSLAIASISWPAPVGDTLYVPTDYSTIQAALDAAVAYDIVQVLPGIYPEDITLKGNVTLRGSGYASTMILGTTVEDVVIHSSGQAMATIEGFSIFLLADDFADNNYCLNAASPITIKNNMIRGNCNGGIVLGSECVGSLIQSNIISNLNSGETGFHAGISVYSPSVTIYNNIISHNAVGIYVSYIYATSLMIVNNTIVYNSDHGIRTQNAPTISVYNCIISSNGIGIEAGIANLSHNNVWDNDTNYAGYISADPTDISVDPQFVPFKNYQLYSYSPCVDAGTATNAPSDDILGTTRPKGSADDIGAYEFNPTTGEQPRVVVVPLN